MKEKTYGRNNNFYSNSIIFNFIKMDVAFIGKYRKIKKCVCIVGGLVITYIVTFIIYCISKIRITYENKETMKLIQTVFVGLLQFLMVI